MNRNFPAGGKIAVRTDFNSSNIFPSFGIFVIRLFSSSANQRERVVNDKSYECTKKYRLHHPRRGTSGGIAGRTHPVPLGGTPPPGGGVVGGNQCEPAGGGGGAKGW